MFCFSPQVVSFNCLRAGYHFTQNTYTKDEHRPFPFRLTLLSELFLNELQHSDFLCLQEIEDVKMFSSCLDADFDFVAAGNDKGQHAFTKPRVFFRRNRFKLVWQNQRSRAVLAQFEMMDQQRDVFVVSVHLQGGGKAERDRENQIANVVKVLRCQLEKLSQERQARAAVVIGGDFNMECPHSLFDSLKLKHVFDNLPFTHKWGEGPNAFLSKLDQIFYGGSLKPNKVRDCFSTEQWKKLEHQGIPNEFHPSDHVCLAANFLIEN